MNIDLFIGIFSALNFRLETAETGLKNKNSKILGDCNLSVLCHSKKSLVVLLRRLTALKFYD